MTRGHTETLRPVETKEEAQRLLAHLSDVMDALLGIVEQETALVRAGRLNAVFPLEPAKAELARLYVADLARVKASRPYLSQHQPEVLAALRQRHESFRALLQINLTVLATAHAVAEGIVRGVAEEVSRQAAPQVYGASGRRTAPAAAPALPLSVSRLL